MTIKTRSVEIDTTRATDSGTYIFPLSSEQPYRRMDGDEILVHSAEAVNLDFLNSGNAPLLDNHDRYTGLRSQLGVISRAWIEKKRVYVEVKFSNRTEAQEIRQDVDDGIIRNVSVGYDVHKIERDDDADSYRVTKWTPREASFVPIPADATVGMGRSHQLKEAKMADEVKTLPGMEPTEEQRAEAMNTAVEEIKTLAETHNRSDLANAFVKGALARGEAPSAEVFKGIMRAELPEDVPLVNRDIGLSPKERKSFSVRGLLNTFGDGEQARAARKDAEFELEAVEAASGESRHGGVVLPEEVMRHWGDFTVDGVHSSALQSRALQSRAALATSGSANVQDTAHLADRFIDNLRNRLVLGQLGMTMLTGLSGNLEIPGGDANIAAAWLGSEDADAAESNPTFRKISMSIKDVAVYTDMTRRMLIQSTIDVEQYVRNQILTAMAEGIDLAGFYGSGSSGQPTGIINTAGIGSVTFAAAVPTRNELIDMRAAITATNQTAAPAFVFDTDMESDLMKAPVDAGSGKFLVDAASGRLDIGNQTVTTNQFTAGDVLAGVYSDAIMGMWGSLELDRSTEAKFLSGGLRIRAIQSVDFGVRRVGSFALGNDGA